MEAEIEVELEFEPYLVVSEGEPGRTVTVTASPRSSSNRETPPLSI